MHVTGKITRRKIRKRCIKQIMTGRMPQVMCGACNKCMPLCRKESICKQSMKTIINKTYIVIIRANGMLKGLQRDNGRMSVKPVKAKAYVETKENRCPWSAEWCCKEIMEDVTRA
jgi:hypothetical protein